MIPIQPHASMPGGAAAPSVSKSQTLWRELVTENPMIEAAAREQGKFFRLAGGTGRMTYIVYGLAALFYLWLVIESLAAHTDLTMVYSYIELGLLTLALPASVYGAISGEREKSTWEALILTRLTPAQIIAGKLLWRVRMIGLVMAFLLPPLLVSRLLADRCDATFLDVLRSQLLMAAWGCLLCAFGLWVSALTQRSITTLAIIACALIGILIALPTLYGMFSSLLTSNNPHDPFAGLMIQLNPFTLLGAMLTPDSQNDLADPTKLLGFSGWPQSAIFLILTAVLIFLTNRRLRRLETPSRRAR